MRGFVEKVIKAIPKMSDEQVKRVLLEVSNEHKLLSSVLDSQSTGIVILDANWFVQQINKAADRILFQNSFDESNAEEQKVWDFIIESEIARFVQKAALENRSNVSEEFTIGSSDGSVRFVIVSLNPFIIDNRVHGNILKIEDITQKRTREIIQRRMENMAGLTNLAAGMAHEIKNPLGAISIHIQLIQKAIGKKRSGDGMLPDEKFLENHLDIVNEEIENLNKLVMDFLFAVRPVKAEFILTEPSEIIKNIAEFFEPEFSKSDVELNISFPEKEKRLLLDPKLFREVLMNIAQNGLQAIKARIENDGSDFEKGQFNINSFIENDKYILELSDNGTGMDQETCSRIFEPYFTTKANGTGLGMTMVYKIIKEFNGDIFVKSEKGKGTVFTIELPVPQTETKLLSGN